MKVPPNITPVPKNLAPQVNLFSAHTSLSLNDLFLHPLFPTTRVFFENHLQKNGKKIEKVETKRRTRIAIMCKRSSLGDLSGSRPAEQDGRPGTKRSPCSTMTVGVTESRRYRKRYGCILGHFSTNGMESAYLRRQKIYIIDQKEENNREYRFEEGWTQNYNLGTRANYNISFILKAEGIFQRGNHWKCPWDSFLEAVRPHICEY